MNTTIMRFIKDEEGATAVEYGVLVALIVAAAVATITALGKKIDDAFSTIKNQLN